MSRAVRAVCDMLVQVAMDSWGATGRLAALIVLLSACVGVLLALH